MFEFFSVETGLQHNLQVKVTVSGPCDRISPFQLLVLSRLVGVVLVRVHSVLCHVYSLSLLFVCVSPSCKFPARICDTKGHPNNKHPRPKDCDTRYLLYLLIAS